jgi:hypothetical protein
MFRRSSHIAIAVPTEDVEGAVAHYKGLFGLEEKSRSEDGIELSGNNFTIWVDRAQGKQTVLQEWVVKDRAAARAAVLASGATITGESSCGFYVSDPYGMTYHVYFDDEA